MPAAFTASVVPAFCRAHLHERISRAELMPLFGMNEPMSQEYN